MGYEGDPCDECGQLMVVRNGSCLRIEERYRSSFYKKNGLSNDSP